MLSQVRLTSRIMENLTVKVTLPKIVSTRITLGLWLMKLGARVTGCKIVVRKQAA